MKDKNNSNTTDASKLVSIHVIVLNQIRTVSKSLKL